MGPHRFQNVFCLLGTNRTKIQPVLKMLRHFAHFVSRYSSVFGLVGEEGEVVSGKGGGGQSSSPRVHPSQCSSLHSVHILLSRVPADVLVGREEREALVMTSPSSVPGIMEEEGEVVSGRREGRSSETVWAGGERPLYWQASPSRMFRQDDLSVTAGPRVCHSLDRNWQGRPFDGLSPPVKSDSLHTNTFQTKLFILSKKIQQNLSFHFCQI